MKKWLNLLHYNFITNLTSFLLVYFNSRQIWFIKKILNFIAEEQKQKIDMNTLNNSLKK